MDKPGYFRGKHFSAYVPEVESLIKEGKLTEAETLLYHLVETTEAESKSNDEGVAPFYYGKLALIYRKQKDLSKEYMILERYSKQKHAPGVTPAKLMERFEKVKGLLGKGK